MPSLASRVVSGVVGAAAVAGLVAVALAASPIEERQKLMKDNGEAMKALAAIAKKEAPFDAAVVKKNAEWIAEDLIKVKDLFPDGSQSGEKETWAKPEIWSDRETFEAIRTKTVEAAQKLAAVTEESAYMPALVEVGNGCKNCHDKFSRPKE